MQNFSQAGTSSGRTRPATWAATPDLLQSIQGEGVKGGVVRRQSHVEFTLGEQLQFVGQIIVVGRESELLVEEPIQLATIVPFVVVGSRIDVVMEGDLVAYTEQLIDRSSRPIDGAARAPGLKTAIVFVIVDQQRGAWREHAREHIVVSNGAQIAWALFEVPDIGDTAFPLPQRRVSGDGHDRRDALIEGGQKGGLPSAAGQSGHGDPTRVCIPLQKQNIQPAFHQ